MLHYIFRKNINQKKSIENVFTLLISNLITFEIKKSILPYEKANVYCLIKNILFIRNRNGNINHITGDVHYIALALPGKKTILTIHDIGSALQGTFLKRFIIKLLWFWLPALKVSKITVISEFTKTELTRLIPFARKKIVVIPNPVNLEFTYSPKEFNKAKPHILHLGTKANKNLERTIEALSGMGSHLMIVGSLTESQRKTLQSFHFKENDQTYKNANVQTPLNTYSNHIDLPNSGIRELYQQCDMVCFASTYEGFGMPIIEAQAMGRPVVTGNVASMPEVAGNGACLVDPFSNKSIKNGILKVIEEDVYREKLIENGLENIKRFKAENIAQQYLKLYKEIDPDLT